MSEIRLNEARGGAAVAARVGDVVTLHLGENPSTGYRWVLATSGPLRVVADDFEAGAAGSAGAAGQRRFTLLAEAAGLARRDAQLRRSWDAPGQAQQRWQASLNIV